ncbi:MAG TPA: family 16 glycoside hydrolase [Bacteroidota bacterium]|nr:family 16 glycoside hydrolase [Bacteroidota bacterium]
MRSYALIAIAILPFVLIECRESEVVIPAKSESGVGQVTLFSANTPSGVAQVVATLTRSGYSDHAMALTISDSGSTASGTFTKVEFGTWHLTVNAFDVSEKLLYTGETDVSVQSGQVTHVSLTLEPASGQIDIVVTWGSAGGGASFSDDFNNGNVNNWQIRTGIWNFTDSLVQTDVSQGHHFLMLPGHDFGDFELQADVMKTSDDDYPEHPGIVFRWLSDSENYVFRINGFGSQSWIQLMRDMDNSDTHSQYIHSEPWLQNDPDQRMDKDTWYTMKVRAVADRIQCKIWKKSDIEPDGWIIDLQDPNYTHGQIGLEYFTGRHRFDNVVLQVVN